MKKLLFLLLISSLPCFSAQVRISDLTENTSPSTNTWLEVADMDATPKSGKYMLTNLTTIAQLIAATNTAVTQATNSSYNYFISHPGSTNLTDSGTNVLAQGGVRMDNLVSSNAITGATLTLTNSAISNIVMQVNALAGTTNDLVKVNTGSTNVLTVANTGAVTITNATAASVPLTINAITGQSGDLFNVNVGGANRMKIDSTGRVLFYQPNMALNPNGIVMGPANSIGFAAAGITITSNPDTLIYRDASNIFAQRNGVNAQQHSWYDTWTDTSNFRNATWGWSKNANAFTLTTTNAGTALGTGGSIILAPLGTTALTIATNKSVILAGTTNQVVFGATNTAPVSSVAPTKWISVQVTGEATVYRLPLYE